MQKALHLHLEEAKKNPKHLGRSYMVFEKHDGWFGTLDFPSCVIKSSAQREIPSLFDLSNKIRSKRPECMGRLIFEIMIEGLEIDSFHILNGILNRKDEQVDGVYLRVHDYIDQFKFQRPAAQRYEFAEEIVRRLDMDAVKMSPVLGVSSNPTVWKNTAQKVWAQGKEGVILKEVNAPYSPEKRNCELMKIKEELTLDLLVTGLIQGKGKYADTLGALELTDKYGIKHIVSGMTDEERYQWWTNPDFIMGKVVEVKAMKKLKDGTLREPRFKAIRYNKLVTEID